MKEKLAELVFILDRSGSMCGLESDTIGGFNSMLKKQQEEVGKANVTTILFDDQIELLHDRFPIDVIKPLTDKDYYVRGCTALLDAIGTGVKKIENVQKRLPKNMKADEVIFVITTDGQENASCEYTSKMIKKMVEKQQEEGWKFIFLGANMDAISEASSIGIKPSRAMSFVSDRKGTSINYEAIGNAVSFMRTTKLMEGSDDYEEEMCACFAPVAEYANSK